MKRMKTTLLTQHFQWNTRRKFGLVYESRAAEICKLVTQNEKKVKSPLTPAFAIVSLK